MGHIRVLIADDEPAVLDSLAAIVASEPDLEVVAEARDARTAIELASRARPDVAILDVRMPGGGGPRATREILRRSLPTRVLALSALGDADSVLSMLRAGALGYAVKTESPEAIVEAIHRCANERMTLADSVTSDLAHVLATQLQSDSHRPDRHRLWRARIGRVLDGEGLRVVFQPIFDLARGVVVGLEALARFEIAPHDSPDAWFAEAEAVGLLRELELAAVRAALSRLGELPESCYLSVNVSPGTAGSPELGEELERTAVRRLVLEMTEHAPVEDYAALEAALAGSRSSGLRLAIDDVGAGFASLRHIVQLGPDLVKLDVSLIRGVDGDEVRRAVVSALTSFSTQIGADVIAEGIENARELEALKKIGVRFGQGFYLARPGPLRPVGPAPGHPPV